MWRWLGKLRRPTRFTFFNRGPTPLPLWLEPWAEEVTVPVGSRADLLLTGAFRRPADAPFERAGEGFAFFAPGGSSLKVLIDGDQRYESYAVVPFSRSLTTHDFVHLVFDGSPDARPGGIGTESEADGPSLSAPMEERGLAIVPLGEEHREALKAACAEDLDIWQIYSVSYDPVQFDRSFDLLLSKANWQPFAIFDHESLVGMSCYIGIDAERGVLEIGNTYYIPRLRGIGFNGRVKDLMIGRAIDCGFRRIEFRVDARNARSQAAMAKIGGIREGVIRQDRITWTGHVRDTVLFSILADEWRSTAG